MLDQFNNLEKQVKDEFAIPELCGSKDDKYSSFKCLMKDLESKVLSNQQQLDFLQDERK